MKMENEKEIVERALNCPKPPRGTYLLSFTTEEQLIKDVAFKWQNATNIMILQHEIGHIPVMHTRRIRNTVLGYSYHAHTEPRSMPKRVSSAKSKLEDVLL